MTYGLWPMTCDLRPVNYGLCPMTCVLLPVPCDLWPVNYDLCPMICDPWPVSYNLCPMTCDLWPVTYDLCTVGKFLYHNALFNYSVLVLSQEWCKQGGHCASSGIRTHTSGYTIATNSDILDCEQLWLVELSKVQEIWKLFLMLLSLILFGS